YELGADAFETLPADPAAPGGLNERVKKGTLTEMDGVGKAISEKVTELVTTGHLRFLDDLRKEFPLGALDLMRVPGLGPRKAAVLIRKLDVANLDDLERVAREGRVRGLKGFGERTEKLILDGIGQAKARQTRQPLYESRRIAEKLLERVRKVPGVLRAEIAGSVRRYAETNGDIDLVVASPTADPAMEAFATSVEVMEVIARGPTKCSVRLRDGLQADLRVVPEAQFATALHHFTGSKQHHVKLRGLARDRGLSISEYGLAPLDPASGPGPEIRDEADLYRALGMQTVPPELREDHGEIELAKDNALPDLISKGDIQGFVHCHSTWSDGKASIEDMVRGAKALGAKFITMTDHSQPAGARKSLLPHLGSPDGEADPRPARDAGALGRAHRRRRGKGRDRRVQRLASEARLLRRPAPPRPQARLQSVVLGRRALGRRAREHPFFGGNGSPGMDGAAPGSQRAQPRGVPRDA